MNINTQKQALRKVMQREKAKLNIIEKAKKSATVIFNLEKNDAFKNSKTIIAYWSMNDEVNTKEFIEKWSSIKDIYLPIIKGGNLEFRLFTTTENLKRESKYGIFEPTGKLLIDYSEIELAIIPGVAFDKNNNRLGRGKAFYDKTLNNIDAIKIGLCFNFQIVEIVPTEKTDIKMDIVIWG